MVARVSAYGPEGRVNPPSGHMRFPGTITIPQDAFEKTLESAARCFRLHGFKDIVLLGEHGGYQRSLKRVADRLDRELAGTKVRVHAIGAYYEASPAGFASLLRAKGYSSAEIGTHAGLADTSLTLAVDPALVRTDRLGAATRGAADGVRYMEIRYSPILCTKRGMPLTEARRRHNPSRRDTPPLTRTRRAGGTQAAM